MFSLFYFSSIFWVLHENCIIRSVRLLQSGRERKGLCALRVHHSLNRINCDEASILQEPKLVSNSNGFPNEMGIP